MFCFQKYSLNDLFQRTPLDILTRRSHRKQQFFVGESVHHSPFILEDTRPKNSQRYFAPSKYVRKTARHFLCMSRMLGMLHEGHIRPQPTIIAMKVIEFYRFFCLKVILCRRTGLDSALFSYISKKARI